VIPVLVGGASMPDFAELPDVLQPLAHRQALEVGNHFHPDVDCLITTLETVLASASSTLSGNREDYTEEIEWLTCDYCQSRVRYGQRVCLGCQAEVAYGLTQAESRHAVIMGLMLGLVVDGRLFVVFRNWLNSRFSWQIPPGFGLGIFTFPVGGFLAFLVTYGWVQFQESIYRKQPPRFIRSTIA
jgi:hypothetical protein